MLEWDPLRSLKLSKNDAQSPPKYTRKMKKKKPKERKDENKRDREQDERGIPLLKETWDGSYMKMKT